MGWGCGQSLFLGPGPHTPALSTTHPRGGQQHPPVGAAKGTHHPPRHRPPARTPHGIRHHSAGRQGREKPESGPHSSASKGVSPYVGWGCGQSLFLGLGPHTPALTTPPQRAATPSSGAAKGYTSIVTAPTTRAYPKRYSTPFSRGLGTGETGLKVACYRRPLPCAIAPV